MTHKEYLISEARKLLRRKFEEKDLQAALDLAEKLEHYGLFTYARRLRQRIYRADPSNKKNLTRLAVATYKDEDLPTDLKFEEAANLIYKHFGRETTKIHYTEAAGILGSIHKKRWKTDNQIEHLYQALEYYCRGHSLWMEARAAFSEALNAAQVLITQKEESEEIRKKLSHKYQENLKDDGYNGVNVAFVQDLLQQVTKNFDTCNFVNQKFEYKARRVREEVMDFCHKKASLLEEKEENYWFYVTWVEACLGLKKTDEALAVFSKKIIEPASWQLESTRQQIIDLAGLIYGDWQKKCEEQEPKLEASADGESEEDFNERKKVWEKDWRQWKDAENLSNLFWLLLNGKPKERPDEKVGLALSGGGFRAALFHIGVLARLAETDMLRHVEVISCVSGGSIIGAYYYLKIKKLLENTPDDQIHKEDYIAIVHAIQHDFLENVNTNLRMRVFSNLFANLQIGIKDLYTRTTRLAELYESQLYAPLLQKAGCDQHIYMHDLFIQPFNTSEFNIRTGNVARRNKVPMLILNATSLNTGHCWQFTASWMGEPPGYLNNEHDARPVYRRMYYNEAPEKFKKVRLSTAVSASSCVPGLFAPVTFKGLYVDGRHLQLVDGGVFDNQGLDALLEQYCNSIIISDASGQMPAEDDPSVYMPQVITRTNAILQERLRDYVFFSLQGKYETGLVRNYALMHLTKGLPSQVVEWSPCDDKYEFLIDETDANNDLTSYGLRKTVQIALAKIRTDLDAFHQTEAYALMYSGYKMTEYELRKGKGAKNFTPLKDAPSSGWDFENISIIHDDPEKNTLLEKKLTVSGKMTLKIFRMSKVFTAIFLIALLALAGFSAVYFYQMTLDKVLNFFTVKVAAWHIVVGTAMIADLAIRKRKSCLLFFLRALVSIVFMPLVALITWLINCCFNWYYLHIGKVRER